MKSGFLVLFTLYVPYGKIPPLRFYFTSKDNAYGITQNVWIDGDVLIIDLEKSVSLSLKRVELKSQNYIYMKKEKCSYTFFSYKCFGSLILKDDFKCCPKKCLKHDNAKNTHNPPILK